MTGFDISDTLAPKSEQLDAVELLGGPRTFTVERVSAGNAEQPINIHLAEFPRPWRPGVSMRRVLAYCWGNDAGVWVGRRVTLFCDETVRFGPEVTGGTRVSHLSHIDGTQRIPLLVKRGKHATYVVEPLAEESAPPKAAKEPTAKQVADCNDKDTLTAMWHASGPERRTQIEARVAELQAQEADA